MQNGWTQNVVLRWPCAWPNLCISGLTEGTGALSGPHEKQLPRTQTSHAPWWLVLVSQFIQVLENSFREQDKKNRSVNMATSFPPRPFL